MAQQTYPKEMAGEARRQRCRLKVGSAGSVAYRSSHQFGCGSQCVIYKAAHEWGNRRGVKARQPGQRRFPCKNDVAMCRLQWPRTHCSYGALDYQDKACLVMGVGGWSELPGRCSKQLPRGEAALSVAQHGDPIATHLHSKVHLHGDDGPETMLLKHFSESRQNALYPTGLAHCQPDSCRAKGWLAMAGWIPASQYPLAQPLAGHDIDAWHLSALMLGLLQAQRAHCLKHEIIAKRVQQDAFGLDGDLAPRLAPVLGLNPGEQSSVLQLCSSIGLRPSTRL